MYLTLAPTNPEHQRLFTCVYTASGQFSILYDDDELTMYGIFTNGGNDVIDAVDISYMLERCDLIKPYFTVYGSLRVLLSYYYKLGVWNYEAIAKIIIDNTKIGYGTVETHLNYLQESGIPDNIIHRIVHCLNENGMG